MRTARLLSFLPGIRKLVRDHRRLHEEVRRLREALPNARRAEGQALAATLAESAAGQQGAKGGTPNGFCPRPPTYFLSPKLGAAYLQIPKAACSSIQARILAAESPGLYAELESTIKTNVTPLHYTPGMFTKAASADGFLRFTFVRHPFNRLLSFYIEQVSPPQPPPVDDDSRKSLEKDLERNGFRFGMPFEEFIGRMVGDPVGRNNPHVRPQAEFVLGAAGLNVDFIGRVESIGRDWPRLNAALGAGLGQIGKLNFHGGQSWRDSPWFDRRTVARLAEHYRYDLWLFGYDVADKG